MYVIAVCVDRNIIVSYGDGCPAFNRIQLYAVEVIQISQGVTAVRRCLYKCQAVLTEQGRIYSLGLNWDCGISLFRHQLNADIAEKLNTESVIVPVSSQRRDISSGEIDKAWCFIRNTLA